MVDYKVHLKVINDFMEKTKDGLDLSNGGSIHSNAFSNSGIYCDIISLYAAYHALDVYLRTNTNDSELKKFFQELFHE